MLVTIDVSTVFQPPDWMVEYGVLEGGGVVLPYSVCVYGQPGLSQPSFLRSYAVAHGSKHVRKVNKIKISIFPSTTLAQESSHRGDSFERPERKR